MFTRMAVNVALLPAADVMMRVFITSAGVVNKEPRAPTQERRKKSDLDASVCVKCELANQCPTANQEHLRKNRTRDCACAGSCENKKAGKEPRS